VENAAEFIDDARRRPAAITYGSSGNYGTMHMPMEMFATKRRHQAAARAGHPAVVRPSSLCSPSVVDAISSGPSTVIQHVKAGKLRVLASWGDKRLGSFPTFRR
jgi:tripartite-type tricarboxylate transporter receptor subunit TctC